MGVDLEKLDGCCSLRELEEHDITVQNVVATFEMEGEFDLEALSGDLQNTEYQTDKHRSLIYRSPAVEGTILLPRNGRVSITGITSREEILRTIRQFLQDLEGLGLKKEHSNIRIENIVATADLGSELDLPSLSVSLGLEYTEYEPEQFPGVIYREGAGAVILFFSSGKIIITKVNTYRDTLQTFQGVTSKVNQIASM